MDTIGKEAYMGLYDVETYFELLAFERGIHRWPAVNIEYERTCGDDNNFYVMCVLIKIILNRVIWTYHSIFLYLI